jgi:uncharacterized protein involved in exopolysaccharide biosynthesis
LRLQYLKGALNPPARNLEVTFWMHSLRPYTLTDYLRLAGRHRLSILIPAAIFVIGSGIAIWQLPDAYESTTFIIVESPQSGALTDRPSIDIGRRLTTIRQQVTTRAGLLELIEKYGLYRKMQERGEPADSILAAMRSDITIDVSSARPDATDAFAISYRCPSPEIARDVTTELANRLITENVRAVQSQASGEIEALAVRSVELSAELRGMESKAGWLMSLKEEAIPGPPGTGVRPAASASREAIRSLTNDLANLRDQQYKLRQQIRQMDGRIAEQKQIVQKQKENPLERDGSSVAALIAKRAELQGQRENYVKTQGLTERHPRVVALDDQIDSINRAIAEVRRQHATTATQTPEERELSALEFDRNKLKIESEVADRQLEREQGVAPEPHRIAARPPESLVPSDAGSARLAQDYVALRQSYKDVTARIQRARLDAEVIESGKLDRFRIIDDANRPEIPVWPNRRLLIFVSALVGLVLGLVCFLLLNLRKIRSFRDGGDVSYYTGLPLLGEIPLVTTPAERARQRRRATIKFAVGAGVAAVAVLALSKVLLISHFFELVVRR